jgi:hypothetical protein
MSCEELVEKFKIITSDDLVRRGNFEHDVKGLRVLYSCNSSEVAGLRAEIDILREKVNERCPVVFDLIVCGLIILGGVALTMYLMLPKIA